MKTTALLLTAMLPPILFAETIQQRFASESNMCDRLSQGLGLTAGTNELDVSGWVTPTNVVVQSVDWRIMENEVETYENCRLVSLTLSFGSTNITADVRLCDDSDTALFSMLLPEVAFSSMNPVKRIPHYILETDSSGSQVLFRRREEYSGVPSAPDYGKFDYLFGNVSVYMQGPLDLRDFPVSILRAGGVDVTGDPPHSRGATNSREPDADANPYLGIREVIE